MRNKSCAVQEEKPDSWKGSKTTVEESGFILGKNPKKSSRLLAGFVRLSGRRARNSTENFQNWSRVLCGRFLSKCLNYSLRIDLKCAAKASDRIGF